MKKILLAFIITLIGFAVQAQEKKNKNAKYDIGVKSGLKKRLTRFRE